MPNQKSNNDLLACGLRFMMAIGPDVVDNFFIKVRAAINPCDITVLVTEKIGGNTLQEGEYL